MLSQKLSTRSQKNFRQMAKELDKQNQVYLATGVVLDTYQIFSKTPISSIKDLKGAKVAGAGYNMRYVEGLGAVGVRGGLTNFYTMLQTLAWSGRPCSGRKQPKRSRSPKWHHTCSKQIWAQSTQRLSTVNKDIWEEAAGRGQESPSGNKPLSIAIMSPVWPCHERSPALRNLPKMAARWSWFPLQNARLGLIVCRTSRSNGQPISDKKGAPGSAMLKAYMAKLKAAGIHACTGLGG